MRRGVFLGGGKRLSLLAAFLSLLLSPAVFASVDNSLLIGGNPIDNQYTVGTGANTSYLVIDFLNGGSTGPGKSYLFEYKWDTAVSSEKMLTDISNAVVSSGSALDVNSSSFDFGFGPVTFINDFSYLTDNTDGRADTYWKFSTGELAPELANPALQEVDWTTASVGVDDRMISANSFDGWTFVDYDPSTFADLPPDPDPRVPTVSALPEPSSLVLLGGISLWLLNGRKSRRAASH